MSDARLEHAAPAEGEFQKVSQAALGSFVVSIPRSMTPFLHPHWGLCGHHGPEQQNWHQKDAGIPSYFPSEWLLVFEA